MGANAPLDNGVHGDGGHRLVHGPEYNSVLFFLVLDVGDSWATWVLLF